MKVVRDMLSLALVASILVGIQILLSDKWLWSTAPSHAYGLIGFVVIDSLLLFALLDNVGYATLGTALLSFIQLGAMLADTTSGQPQGVPAASFRAYLTSDPSYLSLLAIQFAILVLATARIVAGFSHNHPQWIHFSHRNP